MFRAKVHRRKNVAFSGVNAAICPASAGAVTPKGSNDVDHSVEPAHADVRRQGAAGLSPRAACHSTSKMDSISTGIALGSVAIPTAERACLPMLSPNTSTIRSEKPLMTCGVF